jgi:hypothetical protein
MKAHKANLEDKRQFAATEQIAITLTHSAVPLLLDWTYPRKTL